MKKFKVSIIFFLIIITPIMNFCEVRAIFEGTLKSHSVALTPFYIKILKDIGFLLLIFIYLFEMIIIKSRYPKKYIIFLLFMILPIILSFLLEKTELPLYTLRSLLPILILPSIYNIIDDNVQNKISKILLFLFFLNFILQIMQFFKPITYYGIIFGYSLRNPGFFIIPSSSAMFSIICLYYTENFLTMGGKKNIIMTLLCVVSILMTASGTGIIIISFLVMSRIIKMERKFLIKIIMLLVIITGVFMVLPTIINRKDIYISILTRLEIIKDIRFDIISLNSGLGTNIAVLLRKEGAQILDSQYAYLLSNFGLISLIMYFNFIIYLRLFGNKKYLEFVILYLFFGMTTIYFELFPINLIFSINIAYFNKFLKRKREKIENDSFVRDKLI